jgi:hypothetical protein
MNRLIRDSRNRRRQIGEAWGDQVASTHIPDLFEIRRTAQCPPDTRGFQRLAEMKRNTYGPFIDLPSSAEINDDRPGSDYSRLELRDNLRPERLRLDRLRQHIE